MHLEREEQEYRELQRWVRGTKRSAAGRTWRRKVRSAVPASVMASLDASVGSRAGDVLGLALVIAAVCLPVVIGLSLSSLFRALTPVHMPPHVLVQAETIEHVLAVGGPPFGVILSLMTIVRLYVGGVDRR
jgi:hypothetical protein